MKSHTMRVPFRLLFVGWWMAVQTWMVAGQGYKPSVSVSPEVVTLGGNVTVRCSNANYPGLKFSLYKGSVSLYHQTATGSEAKFIIPNVAISAAGIYQCYYYKDQWSDPSDDVHINITDPSIPKPFIKVKPGHRNLLHSSICIECHGPEDGLKVFLRKTKTWEVSQVATATGATANFHFHQVRMEDAGSYICQYHRTTTPFVWSEPSDPLDLILKDPELPKPFLKGKPKRRRDVGTIVTIECQGPESGLTFSLHKSENRTALWTKAATGNTIKFSLPPLRPEDAGNYTCQYYYRENLFVSSEPSDPIEVVVTDMPPQNPMTIIWASAVAGLLLVLFLLVLILVLCKKRRKRSTVKEGNQPVNKFLEQNAGIGQDGEADHDGVTYAVLEQRALKTKQPANQHTGPESCVYASVAKERTRKV